MQNLVQIEKADLRLLAVISDTMAEAARRSGTWIACRPGCTECCMGPFAITQLDALRLRRGLAQLEKPRAERVRSRAVAYVAMIVPMYPGDALTGELRDEDSLPESMDDAPCPALDPESGLCDLYDSRPITCRTFGPTHRVGDQMLGACELCYQGATDEEIAQCAVDIDPDGVERSLLAALDQADAMTIVAYALV